MTKKGKIVFFDATSSRRQRLSDNAKKPRPAVIPATKEKIVVHEETVFPTPKTLELPEENAKGTQGIRAESASSDLPTKSELESYLINFVVEQTGYPEDMVDMDADLEGDLGIDSIKKAQLLGELNEMFHFSVEEDRKNMSLDDFPTLGAIRDFMCKRLGGKPAASSAPESASSDLPTKSELESYLINFVVEQTGYPEDMVDMDADLEGDLGIDSIKKAQLLGELNEMFHFSAEEDRKNMSLDDFPTLGAIRDFMCKRLGSKPAAETEPAASSAPESASSDLPTKSELESYLINFVVEQTGYPEDMVDMDADLADNLGIDSIKKAQLFGAIGEVFGLFPLGEASLGDFLTLRQILNGVLK